MKNTIRTLLLLSAVVCVTPAAANYFANPAQGIHLNIGSAPNPTPADLRRGVIVGQRTVPYTEATRTTAPLFTVNEAAPPAAQSPAFLLQALQSLGGPGTTSLDSAMNARGSRAPASSEPLMIELPQYRVPGLRVLEQQPRHHMADILAQDRTRQVDQGGVFI